MSDWDKMGDISKGAVMTAVATGAAVMFVLSRTTKRVYNRARANGLDPRLHVFLDWWERNGPFPITVPTGGGLRTDQAEQTRLYTSGASNAPTLADTPHGRGAAIDVYPATVVAGVVVGIKIKDSDWPLYQEIGRVGKALGLAWGGDWKSFKDGPHLEVPEWRALPYPPRVASTRVA